MAARRSLGGGRILGSGKSLLSPPSPSNSNINNKNNTQHARNNSSNTALLSPSESSLSLSSQTSTTPISSETEDLTSRVALDDHHGPSPAASASSRLMCPICNEDMVTLLQLNRHLDDTHQNLQEAEQDEVKDWFEQQIKKAKKFQPLALLNQKLKGLDVFESNPSPSLTVHSTTSPAASSATPPRGGHAPASTLPTEPRQLDPDDVVTKSHWQRSSGHDACSDPLCGKRLGAANGNINCRHCGKLFCEEHTMYQMKLSRSAQHEPVRGFWCRVCETCYKTRPGYTDHGLERNHTSEFVSIRRRTVDKAYLEVSRLEKRLSRITQLLANPPPPPQDQSTRSYLWSLAGSKDHIRNLEQAIVTWEDDARVASCPFCQQLFSQYSFRRHHCRTCGRVVCGDPATACSTEVALNVDLRKSCLCPYFYCPKTNSYFQPMATLFPKSSTAVKSLSMCACARTVSAQSSPSQTLPAPCLPSRQTSAPTRTSSSSSEASDCSLPNSRNYCRHYRTRTSRPRPNNSQMPQKSVEDSWMPSPNTM